MAKKQNLMLDLPGLSDKDLLSISWWKANSWHAGKLTLTEIMLTDKKELKKLADHYYCVNGHWGKAQSRHTYRKLFGRDYSELDA